MDVAAIVAVLTAIATLTAETRVYTADRLASVDAFMRCVADTEKNRRLEQQFCKILYRTVKSQNIQT